MGYIAKCVFFAPVLGVLVVLISNPAAASEWQVGLLGGYSTTNKSDLLQGFQKDGFNGYFRQPLSAASTEKHAAIRVFARKFILPHIAIEANYSDYGGLQLEYTADSGISANPVTRQFVNASATRRVSAIAIDLVANFPLATSVSMDFGVGAAYTNVDFEGSLSSKSNALPTARITSLSQNKRVLVPKISAGVNWMFIPQWRVQGRYEYLAKVGSVSEDTIDFHTGAAPQKTIWLGFARDF